MLGFARFGRTKRAKDEWLTGTITEQKTSGSGVHYISESVR